MMRSSIVLLMAIKVALAASPESVKLTLDEALNLALKNNRAIAIAGAKTDEMKSARKIAIANFYPQVSNSSSYLRLTEREVLQFAQGSFGTFPGLGSLPGSQLIVKQGDLNNFLVRSTAVQPLTQLLRIREGARIAHADESVSLADLDGLRNQVALKTRQLYYGLVGVELDRQVADEQIRLADEQVNESSQEALRGASLELALTESRTRLLQARQDELSARMRQSDLFAEFDEIAGLPPGTPIEVQPPSSAPIGLPDKDDCTRLAEQATPEISAAQETIKKAQAAVRSARYEYIPDLSLFGRHDYQDGVAFLYHNYGAVGAQLTYNIFDGGKRRAQITEREAQLRQATENLARLKEQAAANVQMALDKIEQSLSMVGLSREVADLRAEAARIADVQQKHDVVVHSQVTQAVVALSKARADVTKAQLAYDQAQAELAVIIGRLPR